MPGIWGWGPSPYLEALLSGRPFSARVTLLGHPKNEPQAGEVTASLLSPQCRGPARPQIPSPVLTGGPSAPATPWIPGFPGGPWARGGREGGGHGDTTPSSVPAPDSPCPPAAQRGPGGRADPTREQWGAEKGPPAPWGHPLGPPIPYLRTGVSLLSRGARLPLDSLGGGAEENPSAQPQKKPRRHPPVPPLGLIWGGGSQRGTHHVALGSRRAVDAAGTLRGKEGASGRCTPR